MSRVAVGQIKREATEDELQRMLPPVRWAYDHGMPVALYVIDNVIIIPPQSRNLKGLPAVILQKRG